MAFDIAAWKQGIAQQMPGWKQRMAAAGAHSVYGFLAALSLWPLVEAVQSGQMLPVMMGLGSVAGGVGGNLLAHQVQVWKERSVAELEQEAPAWIETQAQNPEVREALDAILVKLEVSAAAQRALSAAEQAWFQGVLREELGKLGNLARYEALLAGVGAIAQDHSVAVHHGIGAGRDLIINLYHQAPGPAAMDAATLGRALDRYLQWVEEQYGRLNLRGIERREEKVLTLTLDDIYVSLTASVRSARRASRAAQSKPEAEDEPKPVDMSSLLALGPRLVITGGPGCGKTTFLHLIASTIAHALHTGDAARIQSAWGLAPPLPLPIFISLADYNRYRRRHSRSSDPRRGTLLAFVSESLIRQQAAIGLPPDFFERLLMDGRTTMLLLDGLDEVANERERTLVRKAVEDLAHNQGISYMVVTSRTRAYQGQAVLPEDFRHTEVQPMSPTQVDALALRWCWAVYAAGEAAAETKRLQAEIAEMERLRQRRREPRLIDSPLLVTIVAIVHYNFHRLPEERAELYEKCVDVLLAERHKPATETTFALADWGGALAEKREWLAFLAFQMMSAGELAGRSVDEDQLKQWLRPRIARRHGEAQADVELTRFVEAMRERGSLLDERGGAYRFLHLSFQEYLCAYYLAETVREVDRIAAFLEEGGRLGQSWWRETVLLVAGYLGLKSQETALAFVRRLVEGGRGDGPTLAGAELAGAAFLELKIQDADTKGLVSNHLRDLITDARLLAPGPLRAQAGRTLARLGDLRPGVGVKEGLPDLVWSAIILPEPFLMGNSKATDAEAWASESPQFACRLLTEPYRISRYPITVAQYRCFVTAAGYSTRRWWSAAGWAWRQQNAITGPAVYGDPYELDNHPQVGVSWYEAHAFCNWLAEAVGQRIRLPSEVEWERAARHTDGRRYPWGGDEPRTRCNMEGTGIGSTCAVGLFPQGDAVCGAADMSGNVREWCQTKWRDNYNDYERKVDDGVDEGDITPRLVRGGSFSYYAGIVRCAARSHWDPVDRYRDFGFRVVLSPAQAGSHDG